MFDVLPASDAHVQVRRRCITTSVAAHAFVVAAAVMLTRGALEATRARVVPTGEDDGLAGGIEAVATDSEP